MKDEIKQINDLEKMILIFIIIGLMLASFTFGVYHERTNGRSRHEHQLYMEKINKWVPYEWQKTKERNKTLIQKYKG